MSHEPPQEPPADSGCTAALVSLARFVRRSLPAEEARAFREHLTDCGDCSQLYRETLATAARTSRQRRSRLAEESRIARRQDARRRVFAAGRAEPRRFGLRLALLPALVILALLGFGPFAPAPGLEVSWEAGEVRLGEEHLGPARVAAEVPGGAYVSLAEGARATLERGKHRLVATGETLLLAAPRGGRELRLVSGQVAFQGAWTLGTVGGVMVSESGQGELLHRGGRFELTCLAGEFQWSGPLGSRTLRAGERWNSEAELRAGP